MKRFVVRLVVWAVVFLAGAGGGFGQEDGPRTALLVANGGYRHFPRLENPVPEARRMQGVLEDLGFDVTLVSDGSKEQILEELYAFEGRLKGRGGTALFHYGGHAVQVGGRNFLIPADADIPDELRVRTRGVDLEEVMSTLESSGSDANIVVLDACRNNPLPGGSRSGTRGLSVIGRKPPNSIIVYSAESGTVAEDGVFTPTLLDHLESPGVSLSEVIKRTRRDVYEKTGGEQIPGSYDQLFTSIFLAGRPRTASSVRSESAGEQGEPSESAERPTERKQETEDAEAEGLKQSEGRRESEEPREAEEREPEAASRSRRERPPETPEGFVRVEGGSFRMGKDRGDEDDKPIHSVEITRDFFMKEHEVTHEEFLEFLNGWRVNGRPAVDPEGEQEVFIYGKGSREYKVIELTASGSRAAVDAEGERFVFDGNPTAGSPQTPVMEVSWYGAVFYCNWLSRQEGLEPAYTPSNDPDEWRIDWEADGYRLPTEAEWEYAARGGRSGGGSLYSGSDRADWADRADRVSWNRGNSGGRLHPVGKKDANGLGLYDMTGNVFEWCHDWYGEYSGGRQRDPRGPEGSRKSVVFRTFRGGSFAMRPEDMPLGARFSLKPGKTSYALGFRVVRPAE